jgi:hypothetical protein
MNDETLTDETYILNVEVDSTNYGMRTNTLCAASEPQVPLLHTGIGRKVLALGFCWLANAALNLVPLWLGYTHWDETIGVARFITGVVICAAWASVLSGLVAAIGLLNLQAWGRTASIIAGIIALANIAVFPIGTAIGIWTLVVLLKAQNSAAYNDICRPA